MLESMGARHQFGGAIALAWYRNPRATIDIDVNITIPPERADPVLGALTHLGVRISEDNHASIRTDGQARLDWDGSFLDVFFATLLLHEEMAGRSREVSFGPSLISILSPEDLVVCKAVFDRPRHWVDIEAMVAWGTEINPSIVLPWVETLLGADSATSVRLKNLLIPTERDDGRLASGSPCSESYPVCPLGGDTASNSLRVSSI
jgi:hypothetical protein